MEDKPSAPDRQFIQLAFVWPCFDCRSLFEIDRVTFNQLESGQLLGIRCPTCLFPPPISGLESPSGSHKRVA